MIPGKNASPIDVNPDVIRETIYASAEAVTGLDPVMNRNGIYPKGCFVLTEITVDEDGVTHGAIELVEYDAFQVSPTNNLDQLKQSGWASIQGMAIGYRSCKAETSSSGSERPVSISQPLQEHLRQNRNARRVLAVHSVAAARRIDGEPMHVVRVAGNAEELRAVLASLGSALALDPQGVAALTSAVGSELGYDLRVVPDQLPEFVGPTVYLAVAHEQQASSGVRSIGAGVLGLFGKR